MDTKGRMHHHLHSTNKTKKAYNQYNVGTQYYMKASGEIPELIAQIAFMFWRNLTDQAKRSRVVHSQLMHVYTAAMSTAATQHRYFCNTKTGL